MYFLVVAHTDQLSPSLLTSIFFFWLDNFCSTTALHSSPPQQVWGSRTGRGIWYLPVAGPVGISPLSLSANKQFQNKTLLCLLLPRDQAENSCDSQNSTRVVCQDTAPHWSNISYTNYIDHKIGSRKLTFSYVDILLVLMLQSLRKKHQHQRKFFS